MTKPRYCPACGTPNKPEAKFCASCGKDFLAIKKPTLPASDAGAAPPAVEPRTSQENLEQPAQVSQTQRTEKFSESKLSQSKLSESKLSQSRQNPNPNSEASPAKEAVAPKPSSRPDSKASAPDPFSWTQPQSGKNSPPIVQSNTAISPKQIKLYFGIAAGAIVLIALLVFFAMSTTKSPVQDSGQAIGLEQAQSEEPHVVVDSAPVIQAPAPEEPTFEQEQEAARIQAEAIAEEERLAAQSRETIAEQERQRLQEELDRVQAENLRIQAEREEAIAQENARAAKAARAAIAAPAPKQDPAQSAAFKRILEKSQSCYRAQDYDCAINSAEIGLDLVANHKELKFIIAESQRRQTEALNNITIQ